ncbi:hypothetical protein BU23DRAFT_642521 [Bimuria novae-zelandiae CBS 107.79]|uniref:Uncharacterized protein n=1 Tax=Bimuria novae-zelandiae CBS 107.79 TaxID=1447943 RepID=A0A6A5VQJ0_9PLEO|nr:hypothetical protein BU23DRAFT_642521 [Bimuria novae-zelandiae CBS 107.79]
MGFWHHAKFLMTKTLDVIEGNAPPDKYTLHPDHAYLGRNYYAKDSRQSPGSARTLDSIGAPGFMSRILVSGSGLTMVEQEQEENYSIARMQLHVHIGLKAVPMPLRLPEEKWLMLRQDDLMDDNIIDEAVGRERELYWVVKAAVVLLVKERAEAIADSFNVGVPKEEREEPGRTSELRFLVGRDLKGQGVPLEEEELEEVVRETVGVEEFEKGKVWKKKGKEVEKGESKKADAGKTRNPLSSPSVEGKSLPSFSYPPSYRGANQILHIDFFAESRSEVVDTLPTNPLALPYTSKFQTTSTTPTAVPSKKIYTNPLEHIRWFEIVVLFRRDTKEIFVRKQDGQLYPVVWTVRAMGLSKSQAVEVEGVKFTEPETEIDDEAWTIVDGM